MSAPVGHSGQKLQARSTLPFAVKLLPGFQVDGTWNVPTTLTLVGCVPLGKKPAKNRESDDEGNRCQDPLRRADSPLNII